MKKTVMTLMLCLMAMAGMAETKTIGRIVCAEGGAEQTGCTMVQHNSSKVGRINTLSCGNYVITVVGKKESIAKENGSDDACYFELALEDDTFRAGDVLTITGMRNIDKNYKANLFFEYSNGAQVEDTNVWNNLGILQEMTFGGGTTTTGAKGDKAGTEPLTEYALYPSTFSFTVPQEADGAKSVKITRNASETLLYMTTIVISREEATGINAVTTTAKPSVTYNVAGQKVAGNARGIVIRDGKKTLNR